MIPGLTEQGMIGSSLKLIPLSLFISESWRNFISLRVLFFPRCLYKGD